MRIAILMPGECRRSETQAESQDANRAVKKSLGEFEQLVLLSVLRLGDDAHTVRIIEELERHTHRRPTHAAVYVALRRLEGKGMVTSALGDPTPEPGGRAKRYFEVTPEAVAPLVEARDALLAMWEGVEVPES